MPAYSCILGPVYEKDCLLLENVQMGATRAVPSLKEPSYEELNTNQTKFPEPILQKSSWRYD